MYMPEKKILTLCVVYDKNRILLGMKKRGFGAGRWNGFGGKVEENETIEEAARRELLEETGFRQASLTKRGVLTFIGEIEIPIEMHVFSVSHTVGEPRETEEMHPRWFLHDEIPYQDMWPNDSRWLPKVLAGKNVEGVFHFNKDTNTLLRCEVKEI